MNPMYTIEQLQALSDLVRTAVAQPSDTWTPQVHEAIKALTNVPETLGFKEIPNGVAIGQTDYMGASC